VSPTSMRSRPPSGDRPPPFAGACDKPVRCRWSPRWRPGSDAAHPHPAASGPADAIRYALKRWSSVCCFLDDGRIELDTNTVERAIRPITLGRKNHLFAGSDGGAAGWATVCSLITTAQAQRRRAARLPQGRTRTHVERRGSFFRCPTETARHLNETRSLTRPRARWRKRPPARQSSFPKDPPSSASRKSTACQA
jgi:hypothetical protein